MKVNTITSLFVSSIPEILEEGKLYISEKDEIALHKCCCGCGEEVVTPLNPAGWRIIKNSQTVVTMRPSIGNGQNRCKSHYFITKNHVDWLNKMTPRLTAMAQARDHRDREKYIAEKNAARATQKSNGEHGLLAILKRWLGL